jgi:hypothetical protein
MRSDPHNSIFLLAASSLLWMATQLGSTAKLATRPADKQLGVHIADFHLWQLNHAGS